VLAATGAAPASDLCEGCWELGGRVPYVITRGDAGTESAPGLGAVGSFRFKPFWSVGFAFDRLPTKISDGPDETISFLTISFEYTFRSTRNQATRPVLFLTSGFAYDHISPGSVTVPTTAGPVTATSLPENSHGLLLGAGAGGLTTLSDRLYLRYEGRLVKWSTFGVTSRTTQILVGLAYRFGR
jgi:hypothetical protein